MTMSKIPALSQKVLAVWLKMTERLELFPGLQGRETDSRFCQAKERCKTYNSCKTEDKCEYELAHPDKKCILKHECSWCKVNLKQSYKHQEWACKKKQ